jgi:thioredoxin reductase (NADPH)
VAVDTTDAFPQLSDAEIAALGQHGVRRAVAAGEYLYREGDPTYDFYVVLSGAVEIVVNSDGEERLIARHPAGRFLGELNLLTGQRVYVSARVAEPGEVLVLSRDAFRHVIATDPGLSDKILASFLARREILMSGAASSIRVIGSRFSSDSARVREFLSRSRIPHEWLDADDREVGHFLREFDIATLDLPVVIVTGKVLRRPTPGVLASYLGLTVGKLPDRCFDLIVVGAGPAGLAAAVYGASEGLRTLVLEMVAVGGQAGASSRIENYFGFPTGISGGDLTQRATIQAQKFGAALSIPCTAVSLREEKEAGHFVLRLSDGTDVAGRAVIVATGARYRKLDAVGLERFESRGVYYAATELEARSCARSPVVVAGGGNSAGQAALFLAEAGSAATIVIRGPDLAASMSRYLVDRIEADKRIVVRPKTRIVALEGDQSLTGVRVSGPGGDETIASVGLFSFIGAEPASEWLSDTAALDDKGFVLTDRSLGRQQLDGSWKVLGRSPLPFETSHPGLFAVGDVRSGSTKRVAAAVGEGSAAVRSVHAYLAFGSHD